MTYDIMELELLFVELDERMGKTIKSFNTDLASLRAGRANPHILDNVTVDYYGVPTPLNQMANISIPEARVLMINVWDGSMLKKVEKAIIDANVGIMPNNDGKVIRLVFPEPTEERRRSLVKDIKNFAENAKVAVRNIRRDTMSELKSLEKNKVISEDILKDCEDTVDKNVSAKIAEIDKLAADKEQEVMKV
ncbi:MAG TPA: ribosome recycling factor [Clostridia bacterium]|jgi:ribosome recycling factor|nr:ribosome recycling factor [Clostridia bacterium]